MLPPALHQCAKMQSMWMPDEERATIEGSRRRLDENKKGAVAALTRSRKTTLASKRLICSPHSEQSPHLISPHFHFVVAGVSNTTSNVFVNIITNTSTPSTHVVVHKQSIAFIIGPLPLSIIWKCHLCELEISSSTNSETPTSGSGSGEDSGACSQSSHGEKGASPRLSQRSASTGALTTLGNDSLRPPGWKRASRRSVTFASSTDAKRLSYPSSTSSRQDSLTLASIISLSLPEDNHPHDRGSHQQRQPFPCYPHQIHSPHISRSHTIHFHPSSPSVHSLSPASSISSRPHSRLSFSPSLAEQTSAPTSCSISHTASENSMRAIGSTNDILSKPADKGEVDERKENRSNDKKIHGPESIRGGHIAVRRHSLPPTEKHDWLTALPTPVFSRSALGTQGIIMPVSARGQGPNGVVRRNTKPRTVNTSGKKKSEEAEISYMEIKKEPNTRDKGTAGSSSKPNGTKRPEAKTDTKSRSRTTSTLMRVIRSLTGHKIPRQAPMPAEYEEPSTKRIAYPSTDTDKELGVSHTSSSIRSSTSVSDTISQGSTSSTICQPPGPVIHSKAEDSDNKHKLKKPASFINVFRRLPFSLQPMYRKEVVQPTTEPSHVIARDDRRT
ncbi:uncharacterized protein FOMMEDRAFT_157174 [Fomitiporia mediterranea MF3/22]|uniref:uncharacterized protein n=1 Tax=Fomitiporia mediterranea (strain MF3/22) TaxID=694068 RepID=UPI00044092B8|nr:uncharacterized protein FOMMEDRAFT_157174 [Fomitiporia mediterranea MF3/22]EJD02002.1 hypothetical protein FOMMEDRAFT_157174 [Fomitiporia mediterranea MF3/22]